MQKKTKSMSDATHAVNVHDNGEIAFRVQLGSAAPRKLNRVFDCAMCHDDADRLLPITALFSEDDTRLTRMGFQSQQTQSVTMIPLNELLVTQHGLCHPQAILQQMVRYVAQGGYWIEDRLAQHLSAFSRPRRSSPIELVRTEDGNCYVHNGHHRCAATWLGGRTYLRRDEYELHERTYLWYLETNPECGYFLTFDPRLHVRNADFLSLQREAQRRFQADREAGERWLRKNVDSYRRRRVLQTVPEFAHANSSFLQRHSGVVRFELKRKAFCIPSTVTQLTD